MAAVDYTSVPLVKLQFDLDDDGDDALIQKAISAASRSIDRWTGTTFYPITEARTFVGGCDGVVWVDPFTDTDGLVVKTGAGGTFPTTVAPSAYVLQPLNAPSRGGAYNRIVIPGGGIPTSNGFPTVEITAAWGWAEVPADVELACRIKAARLFRRKDSPEGVAGTSEFGVVRISRFEDPDVTLLLAPFTDPGIA